MEKVQPKIPLLFDETGAVRIPKGLKKAADVIAQSGSKAVKDFVDYLKDTKQIVDPYDPKTFGDRIPDRQETGIPKETPKLLKEKKDLFPGQEKLSPHTALRSFFGLQDDPVIDMQKSRMTYFENIRNSAKYVRQSLKEIPDNLDDVVKEVKPLFDKNRDLLSEWETLQDKKNTLKRRLSKIPQHDEYERLKSERAQALREIEQAEKRIPELKTEEAKRRWEAKIRRKQAIADRRTEKMTNIEQRLKRVRDYVDLQNQIQDIGNQEFALQPRFDAMASEFDGMLSGIAQKYPDARVYLAASNELTPDVKLSPKEWKAAEQLRKYQESSRDRLEELGIPVIKGKAYMTHLWKGLLEDETTGNAISKKFKEKPTLLRFISRVPNSRPWVPSAHGAMDAYIPVAEYKIATQPFLDRWRPFVDTLQQPRLRRFMEDWLDKNMARQDIGFIDKAINTAVGFEYVRLIGLSMSVGFKHLLKLGGTPAEVGYIATAKGTPEMAKVPVQSAIERLGLKGERNELQLFRHYVNHSDLLRALSEIPGIEELDRSAFGFSTQGAKAIGKFVNALMKRIFSQPVKTIEALDNGVSVFANTIAGQAGAVHPSVIERRIWETIFDTNFRAGVDQPLFQKKPGMRALTMFQMTPFKLAEQKAKWIHDAVAITKDPETGERVIGRRDAFGTHGSSKLIRFLLLVGAAEGIARANDTSLAEMFFHVPFVRGVINATKKGYEISGVGNWKPAASPIVQYISEASKRGMLPAIEEHLKEAIPFKSKAEKMEEGTYPRSYESPTKFALGLRELPTSFELYAEQVRSGKPYIPPSDPEKSMLKLKLERELKEKNPRANRDIAEAVRTGRITEDEADKIMSRARETHGQRIEREAKKMSVEELARGILRATKEEKIILKTIFADKLDDAEELPKETRRRYRKLLNSM